MPKHDLFVFKESLMMKQCVLLAASVVGLSLLLAASGRAQGPETACIESAGQVLNEIMGPDTACRVKILAIASPRFDETNWWTKRDGIKGFGIAWLRQLHGWCAGGDHPPPPSCGVDDYESHVRQALRDTTP